MRITADLSLPETASVYRAAETTDSAGGFTIVESLAATLACRIDPPGKNVQLELYASQIGNRTAHVLNFPAGSDVRIGDRLTINGVDYEALGILAQSWEITRQVVAAARD
jgi:hypothetical protein